MRLPIVITLMFGVHLKKILPQKFRTLLDEKVYLKFRSKWSGTSNLGLLGERKANFENNIKDFIFFIYIYVTYLLHYTYLPTHASKMSIIDNILTYLHKYKYTVHRIALSVRFSVYIWVYYGSKICIEKKRERIAPVFGMAALKLS